MKKEIQLELITKKRALLMRTSILPLICILIFSGFGYARPPEEAELQAASVLGEDIARWVVKREPKLRSLGIYYVHSNVPLDQDYAQIIETEISKNLAQMELNDVSSCAECRSPQVNVMDDRLVISRGAPDTETVKKMGKKYPVEAFLMVEIYRTKLSVTAQALLFGNPSGQLMDGERFKVAALNMNDTSAQVMGTIGLGKIISGLGSSSSDLSTSGNLLLLEELGFGKGGLNLGGISGDGSSLFYINPTILFRGRFSTSMLSYGASFGFGYGFASDSKGFSARSSLDLFLGTLSLVGLEAVYFFPSNSAAETIKSFIGFHVGITLGR